jgi:hypothetical protein
VLVVNFALMLFQMVLLMLMAILLSFLIILGYVVILLFRCCCFCCINAGNIGGGHVTSFVLCQYQCLLPKNELYDALLLSPDVSDISQYCNFHIIMQY